jgi:hypothetical protein
MRKYLFTLWHRLFQFTIQYRQIIPFSVKLLPAALEISTNISQSRAPTTCPSIFHSQFDHNVPSALASDLHDSTGCICAFLYTNSIYFKALKIYLYSAEAVCTAWSTRWTFRYNLAVYSANGIHYCHWEENGKWTVGIHCRDKKLRILSEFYIWRAALGRHLDDFENSVRSVLDRNREHNLGRIRQEAFSAMWIISAKSAFALGPRQATRNFGLACLNTCRLRADFWATVRLSQAQNLAAVPARSFASFLKLYGRVLQRLPSLYVWMSIVYLFDSHHTATRAQELTVACCDCRNP